MAPRRSARVSAQAAGEAAGEECPVCFEPLTVANGANARHFVCSHAICAQCDVALFVRCDDRCPTCRAARRDRSKVDGRTQAEMMQRCRALAARRDTLPGPFPETVFFPVDIGDGDGGGLLLSAPQAVLPQRPASDTDDDYTGDTEMDAETQQALLMDARTLMHSSTVAAAAPRSASLPVPLLADLRSDSAVAGAVDALVNAHAVNLDEFAAAASRLRQARRGAAVAATLRPLVRTTRARGAHGAYGAQAEQGRAR